MVKLLVYIFVMTSLLSCSKSPVETVSPLDQSIKRGRQIYLSNCISCHNANPALDGSLGPKLLGIEKEVLKNKVLWGTYPLGYIPKRKTKAMIKFPKLDKDIEPLYLFLNYVKK